jgi:hypothetical protein
MGKYSIYAYVRCAVEVKEELALQAHREQRSIITVTNRLLREGLARIKAEQLQTNGDNMTLED